MANGCTHTHTHTHTHTRTHGVRSLQTPGLGKKNRGKCARIRKIYTCTLWGLQEAATSDAVFKKRLLRVFGQVSCDAFNV